jgi:hypothetical protein
MKALLPLCQRDEGTTDPGAEVQTSAGGSKEAEKTWEATLSANLKAVQ